MCDTGHHKILARGEIIFHAARDGRGDGTGIRGRSLLENVKVTIGGLDAPVQYAGPQNEYPGLDQVNVAIPKALRGRGQVDLLLTVDGVAANPVRLRF